MTTEFTNGTEVFEVETRLIPEDSTLDMIVRRSKDEIVYSLDPSLEYILHYITEKPFVDDEETLAILDYWGVYRSYDIIQADERSTKRNMYNLEYADHEMNTDPYYQLRKMDTFKVDYDKTQDIYKKPSDVLFSSPRIKHIPLYSTVKQQLQLLDFVFDLAVKYNVGVVAAGEYVFKMFMGLDWDDDRSNWTKEEHQEYKCMHYAANVKPYYVQLYFVQQNLDNIELYINALVDTVNNLYYSNTRLFVIRTNDVISISNGKDDYIQRDNYIQIDIKLKLYKTVYEVLYSFDVDCECIGWDGVDVWATERCMFALNRGYNTVNFNHTLNLYEYVLANYGQYKMSIKVPDIGDYNINRDKLDATNGINKDHLINFKLASIIGKLEYMRIYKGKNIDVMIDQFYKAQDLLMSYDGTAKTHHVRELHGLDILLDLEIKYMTNMRNYANNNRVLLSRKFRNDYYNRMKPYSKTIVEIYRNGHMNTDKWTRLAALGQANIYDNRIMTEDYDILTNLLRTPDDVITMVGVKFRTRNISTQDVFLSMIDEEFDEPNNGDITTNVIDALTISDEVYRDMHLLGKIQMSKTIDLEFGYIEDVIVDKESWYIGMFVSAK